MSGAARFVIVLWGGGGLSMLCYVLCAPVVLPLISGVNARLALNLALSPDWTGIWRFCQISE